MHKTGANTFRWGALALAASLLLAAAPIASAAPAPDNDPYRPSYHYTAAENFMNDPNGLIYHNGRYHLFYQYNPTGLTAGNGSWGHAVSTDLVSWTQLPIAITFDPAEEVWSGSVVFDRTNSSGMGTSKRPPLVAIYTSRDKATGIQSQALAASLDDGLTWTKYSGNPVLDLGSRDFRDPKVFWDRRSGGWRMVVALAAERKVSIYSSKDLLSWHHESDFGPAGAADGVWECPDLFPLQLDGNPDAQRWVMVVSVSGKTQYFVGYFDGSTFSSPDASYTAPAGEVLADFEGTDYGTWTATGSAFGQAPSRGGEVTGADGAGFADSFGRGDPAKGTLTSPPFTVNKPYLNFLVGGGNHPIVPGGSDGPPSGAAYADFEGDGYGTGWTTTGDFAGTGPTRENLSGQLGAQVLDTCVGSCDPATGTISSPEFTVSSDYVNLLVAGGNHPASGPEPTAVNLVVGGKVVATATGNNSPAMDWVAWDVRAWKGLPARIEVVDQRTADWGHLMVDHIMFSGAPAAPWNAQTAVNLLVDGQVVRTATGQDSAHLDWASWDLADLQGKQARIELVDKAVGGWGHLYADQFTLAHEGALSAQQRVRWIDHGADFYAAVTYNDLPQDRRVMLGWLGNWDYANSTPTGVWRGAQSIPRELTLTDVAGRPTLVQQPARELRRLATRVTTVKPRSVTSDVQAVKIRGRSLLLDVTMAPGSATTFGVDVRVGGDQRTRIGYDVAAGQLFVDRTRSGDATFSPLFSAIHRATLDLHNKPLRLQVYVDHSSVEVFANGGRVAITDLVYPDRSSDGVQVFAEGGTAQLKRLTARQLSSPVKN